MAITLNFGVVNKRRNSTFVPSPETMSYTMDVVLKQPTSDHSPEFYIKPEQDNIFPYNYCQWGSWYYFIDDIIRERNNLYRLKCSLDVLATYKAEILQTSAFVLYDTTANSEIVDKRLSIKTTTTRSESTGTLNIFEVGSTILLGIVGKATAGIYAVPLASIKQLYDDLGQYFLDLLPEPDVPSWDPDPDDLSTILQNVGEAICNVGDSLTYGLRQLISSGKASDCIKSALLVPVLPSDFPGQDGQTIYLGEYQTSVTGKLISQDAKATAFTTVSIPWQSSDWRRNAPYTHVYLTLPYVGTVNIPTSEIVDCASLNVTCSVSVNGTAVFKISKPGAVGEICRYSCNVANNFMIGASNISPLSQVQAIGGAAAAGAAVAAPAVGAIAGIAGLVGTLNSVQPVPSCIGGGGGIAHVDSGVVTCFTVFHDTNVAPDSVSSVAGTPAMSSKTLSGLTGYVQTLGASVAISGSASARKQINSMLDSGIFIE